jgi:predicted GH43/DUF377 family glycosyl hydrolase
MFWLQRYAMHAVLLSLPIHAGPLIDFEEEMRSDFVLETKKIDVPGFPDAYNPSLVKWKDGFLLSFRTGEVAKCPEVESRQSFLLECLRRNEDESSCERDADQYVAHLKCRNQIGLILLDQDFEPVGTPQILYIHYPPPFIAERQHDPRLLFVGEKLFMVYSNMVTGWRKPEIRRPFVVEILNDQELFFASTPVPVIRYEGEDPSKWSKNWVPFEHNKKLNLSHHINPHIVFRFDGTIACSTLAQTIAPVEWNYGELRGGTSAILDDDGSYLAIFHSSVIMESVHSDGEEVPHYFMGAYTFSSDPPFALTAISSSPIIGENFFHGEPHKAWKEARVVFPGGLILGPEKIWVAYGRQDHEIWIATLDKKGLKQSLTPL